MMCLRCNLPLVYYAAFCYRCTIIQKWRRLRKAVLARRALKDAALKDFNDDHVGRFVSIAELRVAR